MDIERCLLSEEQDSAQKNPQHSLALSASGGSSDPKPFSAPRSLRGVLSMPLQIPQIWSEASGGSGVADLI
jgi:hypothetical protein